MFQNVIYPFVNEYFMQMNSFCVPRENNYCFFSKDWGWG